MIADGVNEALWFAEVAFPQLWEASSTPYDGDGADRRCQCPAQEKFGKEGQLRVAVVAGTVERREVFVGK